MEIATLAGGCFWCTEAIFKRLKGVELVVPGYAGGKVENPSYEEVSTEKTGHAESIQITFDPNIISFEKLLAVFFKTHDPTQLNRQGNDVGEQYRSVIFYHNKTQKQVAEKLIKKLNDKEFDGKIVTQLAPYQNFYQAEDYHQDFYDKNPHDSYCQLVIDPKIEKLTQEFRPELKKEP